MNKVFLLLVVLMMLFAVVLCACDDKKEEVKPQEVVENVEEENVEDYSEEEENKILDPNDVVKLKVSLNGGSIQIGDRFEDVKDRLGAEIKPSQSYTPCGGNDDEKVTTHYYDGLEVEETFQGIIYHAKISGYDYPNSTATLAGIKLGDTPDTVRNTFGSTPDTDSEYIINYTFGSLIVSFSLDFEGTGLVNYISIDDMALGGV